MRLFKIKYNFRSWLLKYCLSMNQMQVFILQNESCISREECLDQSQNTMTFSTMHSLSEPECGHCKRPAKLRCATCTKVYYCSPKHQSEHWKYHKKQCFQAEDKNKMRTLTAAWLLANKWWIWPKSWIFQLQTQFLIQFWRKLKWQIKKKCNKN